MIRTGNLASNTVEQHSVNKNIICVTGDDDLNTVEQHSVIKILFVLQEMMIRTQQNSIQ